MARLQEEKQKKNARLVPGSKEDTIRKNRIAFLYFMEEFIGFRSSLHWLRRNLETGSDDDLEHLFYNVGIENFLNFQDLVACVEPAKEKTRWNQLRLALALGMYHREDTNIKFASAPNEVINTIWKGCQVVEDIAQPVWATAGWIKENGTDALENIAWGANKLAEAKEGNIYEVCYFARLLVGRTTLLENLVDDNIEVLADNASINYFPELQPELKRMAKAITHSPKLNWHDALSRNQIKSKVWLLDELEKMNWITEETTTIIVGGWLGILPFLAGCRKQEFGKVLNVDIDKTVNDPSCILNVQAPDITDVDGNEMSMAGVSTERYQVSNKDIRSMDFTEIKDFVIIDTITEHFHDHGGWVETLPKGTRVVLQGNNMFDVPDHVNCFSHLDEFVEECGVSKIYYQGELNLEKCNRFMVIGEV